MRSKHSRPNCPNAKKVGGATKVDSRPIQQIAPVKQYHWQPLHLGNKPFRAARRHRQKREPLVVSAEYHRRPDRRATNATIFVALGLFRRNKANASTRISPSHPNHPPGLAPCRQHDSLLEEVRPIVFADAPIIFGRDRPVSR